jgi:hypothetical protein
MLPCRAVLKPAGLYVALRDIPPGELRDAFMQQTVERVAASDELIEVPEAQLTALPPTGAPAGIVFHVGRCGSTLVSQLLKQLPGVTVYSEPLPFNDLLVPPQREPRARLVAALRVLGDLYARHAGGPCVIKFSSWNTLYCEVLCEAFPTTPWVLCLRDPLEVAVSLANDRPGWLAAGSPAERLFAAEVAATETGAVGALGADAKPGAAPGFEPLAAKLLSAFARAAARLDPHRGLVVEYPQLPAQVWERIAPHFGLQPDAEALARMRTVASKSAKAPLGHDVAFTPDSDRKRAQASPALTQAIEEFARPAWAALGQ